MLRFILLQRGRDEHNGREYDALFTFDADVPPLQAYLTQGGCSELGFDQVSLAGVEVLTDDRQ